MIKGGIMGFNYEVYGRNYDDKDWQFFDYPKTYLGFIICIIKRSRYDIVNAHKRKA